MKPDDDGTRENLFRNKDEPKTVGVEISYSSINKDVVTI